MIQKEMLEYQEIDKELNRIEKDLRKNEYFVKRKQYKSLYQGCEDNIAKFDVKAADLRSQLAAARQNIDKINSVIEEYFKEIKDVEGEDELNYMTKKLNDELKTLNDIEQEIKRVAKEGEEIVKTLDDINAKLPKISALYNKCSEEFAKATDAQKPRVAELKVRQAELKKSLDPAIFEVYKKISDGQIHPVFVPLVNGCQCGGCRMEMPKAVVDAQLSQKDHMRCEHCGRIIYKEQ